MSWTAVRVGAPDAEARRVLGEALVRAGAAAVQELDDGVVTHVPDSVSLDALRAAVHGARPGAVVECTALGHVEWSRAWTARVGVQRLGRIVVAPPWLARGVGDAEHLVVIEPAMAFGTGEHESTRGVLRLLQRVVRPGDVVADVGTGSAVLSIAAAKLGAARVAAIELDADAIGNAEANVARNGVADRVTVLEGDAAILLPLLAPVRVVLANIVSSVLRELLPVLGEALAPGGEAILGGILLSERAALTAALTASGWRIDLEDVEGDWWSSAIVRS